MIEKTDNVAYSPVAGLPTHNGLVEGNTMITQHRTNYKITFLIVPFFRLYIFHPLK